MWAGDRLPEYMIPSRFYMLESFPLTPSGKVDRKALERMDALEVVHETDYVAPYGELESAITGIWQTALRRERVGIHDNFFALGGHSLMAVSICSRLSLQHKREVPLRWLLEHPTVARLAARMAPDSDSSSHLGIARVDRENPIPMSFAQQGMWLLQQTLPDSATYNQPIAWYLSGQVEQAKVQVALQRIVERHEVLRTVLLLQDGDLQQRIYAAGYFPLPWRNLDLQATPSDQQAAALAVQLQADARRPFDLARAPLWRVVWIQLAEHEQVLGITFHHSIIDEWSMRLVCREFELLYAADGCLESVGLPELPVQYADFSAWQRQHMTGDFLERQRLYWQTQLTDPPPALVLPADHPRTIRPSGRGAIHEFQLARPAVKYLRVLAREEQTTLFTVMLAAFQVWLHRYTGATDLVVGTPFANRERPEVQQLVGLFLNTLPIRMRLEGEPGFREVLRQVRGTLLEAFSHSDLPFEQMVEMADKERSMGAQPFYQVMFVLLEEELAAFSLDQVEARPLLVETLTSKNDLMLSVDAKGEAWSLRFEYSTDLFTAETVARMANHLTELLHSITKDPDAPINLLNLISPEERHQILVEWNDTARDYPRDQCIHQLFEEQVERTPEAVAVVFEDQSLTYQDLNGRADRLARHLLHRGVGSADVVGLRVERSLEMIVGLLGILKVGAAYWAVEENLPNERLRVMLEDAKPRLLIVRRNSFEVLSELVGKITISPPAEKSSVVSIEDLESNLEDPSDAMPHGAPDDAAYISYTSGSTGQPKGVVVPHRGVARLVNNPDYVILGPEETLLHLSPLSFDASTFEIWGGLLNGGRVVMMPAGPPSLSELAAAIRMHRVTTLWLTAGLFHLMVDQRLDDLKTLRQLLAGGDVLSPGAVSKARLALTGCRIINGYGPTENTTFTCCHEIVHDTVITGSVPIGRPIANTRVYILDPNLQPVPIGVAGELYAGGDGLASGYLNQPLLTSERFVPDPFATDSAARLYRTGDQCRWLANGAIEFLGRLDQQVKIRGFRVEPGEVEVVLQKHPLVGNCVVTLSETAPGAQQLVGYVSAAGNDHCSGNELRDFAAQYLPSYMVPHDFVWLEQFPLLANGKLDRNHLPAPEKDRHESAGESGQAKNLLELELIRIWEKLFQRSEIGRNDNFFDLGGHSLKAVRLAAEIEKLLGQSHPIASLFQSPTIASFARRLADNNWAPAWSSLVPLQPRGSKPPIFFIHGIGGDVFVFLELAKLLGEDQPSYGIQALGVDGRTAQHRSITSMASHYAREIISFHPSGPYQLAGYSMGGIIAYEIAQQLRASGHEVELLALFDSEPLKVSSWAFYGLFVPERCLYHFIQWVKIPISAKFAYIERRWSALHLRLRWNNPPQVTADVPERDDDDGSAAKPGFLESSLFVARAYHIRRYPGRLDLFSADDANTRWRWFWKYMAIGGVSFHRIKGNHGQILDRDFVSSLALALTALLIQRVVTGAEKKDGRASSHDDHVA